eukprot:2263049-Pyramimonas_sp.AAC.1
MKKIHFAFFAKCFQKLSLSILSALTRGRSSTRFPAVTRLGRAYLLLSLASPLGSPPRFELHSAERCPFVPLTVHGASVSVLPEYRTGSFIA